MVIHKSEFARMVGVGRAAISIALKAGRIHPTPDGRIDTDDPANAAYLSIPKRQRRQAVAQKAGNPAQKAAPSIPERKKRTISGVDPTQGGGPAEIDGETYTMAELRKMIADANLKEQKLAMDRGELVTRADVKVVFARMYEVHASQLKTLAEKIGPDVAAAFGLQDADTMRVQELMDGEVRRALSQIKKELDNFVTSLSSDAAAGAA